MIEKLNKKIIALGAPKNKLEKTLLNVASEIRFAMSGSIANESTVALAVVDTEQMNAIKDRVQMLVGFIRLTAILAVICAAAAFVL